MCWSTFFSAVSPPKRKKPSSGSSSKGKRPRPPGPLPTRPSSKASSSSRPSSKGSSRPSSGSYRRIRPTTPPRRPARSPPRRASNGFPHPLRANPPVPPRSQPRRTHRHPPTPRPCPDPQRPRVHFEIPDDAILNTRPRSGRRRRDVSPRRSSQRSPTLRGHGAKRDKAIRPVTAHLYVPPDWPYFPEPVPAAPGRDDERDFEAPYPRKSSLKSNGSVKQSKGKAKEKSPRRESSSPRKSARAESSSRHSPRREHRSSRRHSRHNDPETEPLLPQGGEASSSRHTGPAPPPTTSSRHREHRERSHRTTADPRNTFAARAARDPNLREVRQEVFSMPSPPVQQANGHRLRHVARADHLAADIGMPWRWEDMSHSSRERHSRSGRGLGIEVRSPGSGKWKGWP